MYPGLANCPNSQSCSSDAGKNRNTGIIYFSIAQSRIIARTCLIIVFCSFFFFFILSSCSLRKERRGERERKTMRVNKKWKQERRLYFPLQFFDNIQKKNNTWSRLSYFLDSVGMNGKDPRRWGSLEGCHELPNPKRIRKKEKAGK